MAISRIDMNVDTIDIPIKNYIASMMIDAEVAVNPANFELRTSFAIERLCRHIVLQWRVATREAPREFVCKIPTTWVQHLRKRLGWTYKAEAIYHTPIEAFPELGIPELERKAVRLCKLNLSSLFPEEDDE